MAAEILMKKQPASLDPRFEWYLCHCIQIWGQGTKTHRSLNLHIAQVEQAAFFFNNSAIICSTSNQKSLKKQDKM